MKGSFDNLDEHRVNIQNYYSLEYSDEIFQAFVDMIIPRTLGLAELYGRIQYYGALDLYTDEYMILSLNSNYYPVAVPMAEVLEAAANQVMNSEATQGYDSTNYTGWSAFGRLTPYDRLKALTLIDQRMVEVSDLPMPFQNDPDYVLYILSAMNRLVLMGYYSEWSGYGSTRLNPPNQRTLEYFPISWQQVGYPGPSLGYRALRINNSR